MPIAYLDVPPGIDLDARRHVVEGIYSALSVAYPFPDDHRVFIREWAPDSVSQNGLLGSEPARPVMIVHGPENVDPDAKRTMLRDLNAAVRTAYDMPDFMIFIQEYPLSRVAHNGNLHAENAKRVEDQSQAYPGSTTGSA